jgi:hypothetical protein
MFLHFFMFHCIGFRLKLKHLWLSAVLFIPSDYHRASDGGWRSQVPSWMFLLHVRWWLHGVWRVICSSGTFQTVLVSVQFHYCFMMWNYLYILFKTMDGVGGSEGWLTSQIVWYLRRTWTWWTKCGCLNLTCQLMCMFICITMQMMIRKYTRT